MSELLNGTVTVAVGLSLLTRTLMRASTFLAFDEMVMIACVIGPPDVLVPVAVTLVRAPVEAMLTLPGAGGMPTSARDKPAFSVRYVSHTVVPAPLLTGGATTGAGGAAVFVVKSAEAAPSPTLFRARTEKLYVTPIFNELIVQVRAVVVHRVMSVAFDALTALTA